jgi:membrane-bound serine protease (ClpP class)
MKKKCFPSRLILVLLLYISITPTMAGQTYIIPLKGDIEPFRLVYLRRSIEKATDADRIIFDINTFGGRVDTALQITTLIGSLDETETIAFISAGAESLGVSWSAGALISFSARKIYMASGTSMGAAAPVYQSAEGITMAPEKTVSAVRGQMAALAEKNGYPEAAALGMVDMDVIVREVTINGKKQLIRESDLESLENKVTQENGEMGIGPIISGEGKLLTLTAGEMEKYGISSGTVKNRADLLNSLGLTEEDAIIMEETSADKLVALITGGILTSLLITVGLVAIYLEISSPGFGLPGTAAIIAFSIVFLGGALMGTMESLELLLFLLGVALLAVEIFLIPGFGVTGISGLVLMAAGLILSRQDFIIPAFEWQTEVFLRNMMLVLGAIVSSGILAALIMTFFPRLPLFNRLILTYPGSALSESSHPGENVPEHPNGEMLRKPPRTGTAVTDLRPAGKARFDGEILPVESDGEYIKAGTAVSVIEQSGNRIKVKKV